MTKVRTTLRPDLEVDVSDAEYTDLKRLGLLIETPPPVQERRATPPANKKES
jgi:hypothetical protein